MIAMPDRLDAEDATDAGPEVETPRRGSTIRRLLRQPKGAIGLTLVAIYALLLLFGQLLAPHDPYAQNFAATLRPPSAEHWFGTDQLGRDVFSRILTGARSSLGIGIGGVAIAFAIGVPVGIVAGYRRGWTDVVVSRAADIMLSFPDIVFALAIVAILGATTQNVIIAVGLVSVPVYIRTARAVAMSTMAEPFVEGSVSLGCSPARVIFRHILPNMAGVLATLSSLLFASTLLAASGLGFLGLGVQPPEPEWGTMLGESRSYIRSHPYLATFPGLFLAVSALAFNLLGEALRSIYDPTAQATVLRKRRAQRRTLQKEANGAGKANVSAIVKAEDLEISYLTPRGPVVAVQGVDLELHKGRTLAVVGESGSGKSTLLRAIATLLPAGQAEITRGTLRIGPARYDALSDAEIRTLRRDRIGLVFQDAASALNPVMTVGAQLDEALSQHGDGRPRLSQAERTARAVQLLADVRMPDPERRLRMYPYEFSGGMKQRIVIALALAQHPDILLADEPTSALDVTIQQQILTLLRDLQRERGMAMMIVTHDLGLVTRYADDIAVMYAGRIVEAGPVAEIFGHPRHPYTRALRQSSPRIENTTGSKKLQAIGGEPPAGGVATEGCAFAPRCDLSRGRSACTARLPGLRALGSARTACHFAEELA